MAEPDWTLLQSTLQSLQADVADMKRGLESNTRLVGQVLDEVQGLKRMSKMALGTASGAEMQAEDAQRAADLANKRLDELFARVEALETR